ncbi:MAG: hypothetical protein A6F71_06145 [Cycloclasticus sp. symbiont of Poecilosclerida sp. M]|nr:MAG: hypothetical protein A6F71_06145 [Cycloclasticus sp. symbiont of Poecilosclerida sp. M]
MKAFCYFLLYFLFATILGALVAFPAYQLADSGNYPFDSWVTRFSLLFLIIGLFPLMKIHQLSFRDIGYSLNFKEFSRSAGRGFINGLGILLVVIGLLVILDVRAFEDDATLSANLLLAALLSGVVVALIEETLYRGVFFTVTERWNGTKFAVITSSFFYAIFHFIKPAQLIDPTTLHWLSGFEVILNAYLGVFELHYSDLLALLAVGLYLGLVRYKNGSLATCIGLHASWVFLIKITKELTDNNHQSTWRFLTGEYDGIIGLLAASWLLVVSIHYALKTIRHKG